MLPLSLPLSLSIPPLLSYTFSFLCSSLCLSTNAALHSPRLRALFVHVSTSVFAFARTISSKSSPIPAAPAQQFTDHHHILPRSFGFFLSFFALFSSLFSSMSLWVRSSCSRGFPRILRACFSVEFSLNRAVNPVESRSIPVRFSPFQFVRVGHLLTHSRMSARLISALFSLRWSQCAASHTCPSGPRLDRMYSE